jgi:hypothetical protein
VLWVEQCPSGGVDNGDEIYSACSRFSLKRYQFTRGPKISPPAAALKSVHPR